MICWSDVRAFAPQLASVPPTAQSVSVAYANRALSPSLFDGENDPQLHTARLCLAAHFASTFPSSTASSGTVDALVASESVCGVSRSYVYPTASSVSNDASLASTAYGRMLQSLLQSSPLRVGFAF